MTKDEVIEQLIKENLIVKIGEEYYVVSRTTKPIPETGWCKNLPERYKTVTTNQMYNFFIQDAEIPFKSTGSLVYLLHTRNDKAVKVFRKEVIDNPTIDYSQLIQNIKRYYKDANTVKYSVSNLFTNGIWRTLYENSKDTLKPDNTKMR